MYYKVCHWIAMDNPPEDVKEKADEPVKVLNSKIFYSQMANA